MNDPSQSFRNARNNILQHLDAATRDSAPFVSQTHRKEGISGCTLKQYQETLERLERCAQSINSIELLFAQQKGTN